MKNGVLAKSGPSRAAVNANIRSLRQQTLETVAANWSCKKRDGQTAPFQLGKIRDAVSRCFASCGLTDHADTVEKVLRGVVYALAAHQSVDGELTVEVEEVQRYVVQQLFVNELFDAGEHYQNYREEHRKKRLTKPISVETQTRFTDMQRHFPTDLQIYQFMSKFARWNETLSRRETWWEAVHGRIMPWLRRQGAALTEAEWAEMADAMYEHRAGPAMRVVQMAGPALDRCNVGAYNCAFAPVDDLFAFPEALYILMQGTGHGFSVEDEYVSKLPRIAKWRGNKPETLVVPDSTEGWCDSYHQGLQRWFDGYDVWFDVSGVRKKNTPLKVKGGRASGPEPFLELMSFTRNMIKARAGRYLEDADAHRLMCFTGRIVQVGGVRRAATISLSELTSRAMREIKHGAWTQDTTYWPDGKYLSMANNSAVYDFDGPPPVETFMEEWLALVKSKSGERGIFNRRAAELCKPARRKSARWGCNPCAEIILRPHEFCNLSIAIARPNDTVESLKQKVRIAAYFGMVQCLLTKFRYIRDDWRRNCEDERLLGVDVTGHADCPLLRYGAPGREELMVILRAEVDKVATELSRRWGINRPAADTTIKPGGDSSIFFDCASGLSARHAQYWVRWVREAKDTPVAKFLIDAGVPHADAPEAPERLFVFGFPKKAPEGATLRDDMTAIQQFHNWLQWKEHWAEHSVSTTINVEEHEWPGLGAEVYKHIDKVTGVAFLPKDNGTYTYAPNEELTKEQYDAFVQDFPELNWAKLTHYEDVDQTVTAQTMACVGGSCDM